MTRTLRIGERTYPVLLPSIRDPRLHVASVIISVQVLGQVVLDFEVSIAQILLSIGTCAALEVGIAFWRKKVIAWPASALLTGNGVALLLRVPGTRHGDWWNSKGWWIFVGTAAISLLSKYAIRARGRPVFNPSNVGLVLCFLVLQENRVDPQDLWWGPMSPGLAFTYAVILIGGLTIVMRMRMVVMAVTFWLTFASAIGILALSGHCMSARWSVAPVCGASFWWVVIASPEIFVFMFFMITDPRTAPLGQVGRALYGFGVAIVAALFVAPQRTEFGTKVGILGGLVLICAIVPILERILPAAGSSRDRLRAWLRSVVTGRPVPVPPAIVAFNELHAFDTFRGFSEPVPEVALPRRASRLRPLVLGTSGVATVFALVLAGTHAREATGDAVDVAAVADRPSLDAEIELPPITIDPDVKKASSAVDEAEAEQLAHDLVLCLDIIGEARRTLDHELATTAASGSWLRAFDSDAEKARSDGVITVSSYEFDTLRVVLVRDPKRPQFPPRLGVEAEGTVIHSTYGSDTAEPGAKAGPYTGTFIMAKAGEGYVVAAEILPDS